MIRIALLTVVSYSLILTSVHARDTALKLARKWQTEAVNPVMGSDGRILFTYGEGQPIVVCSPLMLCDIALEPGEQVQSVNVGDSARWIVEAAVGGQADNLTEHVIVKPISPDLTTSIFVGTDRRTYLLTLTSVNGQSMGKVGFLYGNMPSVKATTANVAQKFQKIRAIDKPTNEKSEPQSVEVETLAADLDFRYRISGPAVPWRPVRVYDNGLKTFIDFDAKAIRSKELPIPLDYDLSRAGEMMNYRYDTAHGRMIIDRVFTKAALVLGEGFNRTKIMIHKERGG